MSENRQKRTLAPRTSRPKPVAAGNEEAGASLQLGEFQDVDTLTLSEASLVINALVAKRRADRRNVNETEWVGPPPFFARRGRGWGMAIWGSEDGGGQEKVLRMRG